MPDWIDKKCVACHGGEPALTEKEIQTYLKDAPGWKLSENNNIPQILRVFLFKTFSEALRFTNQIGDIAEEEGHHPSILTEWGRVTVTWWTHAVNGLHQNDFIMAAKTNKIYEKTISGSVD